MGNVQTALFGHTMAAARVFPALEGTLILVLSALIAAELGGAAFAQALAALGVLTAGIFLRPGTLFQPVVLDQLWWTLALYTLLRVGRAAPPATRAADATGGSPSAWPPDSDCSPSSASSSSASPCSARSCATPLRRALRTPWPWLAADTRLRHRQSQHRRADPPRLAGRGADARPRGVAALARELALVRGRAAVHGGFTAWPLAVAGAVALLFWKPLRAYRAAGWACVLAFALLLALHGKAYYIGPVYPTLLAAGAVWLEGDDRAPGTACAPGPPLGGGGDDRRRGRHVVAGGASAAEPRATARYIVRAGYDWALGTNRGGTDLLPQDFADQTGWRGQATALARVYRSLSPADRARR